MCMYVDPLSSFSEVVDSTRIFPALSITICVAIFNQLCHTQYRLSIRGYSQSVPHRAEVKANEIMHVKK